MLAGAERTMQPKFLASSVTRSSRTALRRFARSRPNLPLDLGHIAEEIADLGTERRSRMRSWARRIVEPLLLLQHSPAQDPQRGWIVEIVNFRREISDHLTESLRRDLKRQLPRLYHEARVDLRRKLAPYGEAEIAERFPERCPYSLDQVLGDFWPAQSTNGQKAESA